MHQQDLNPNINHEYMKMFGDVVVGEYHPETGQKISEAQPTDPAKKAKLDKMYAISAALGGASLLPVVQKAGKPIKAKKRNVKKGEDLPPLTPALTQLEVDREPLGKRVDTIMYDDYQDFEAIPKKKKNVYLHNLMGKIKMQVEDVLESQMAYCLVFACEDDIVLEPKAGETLQFTDPSGDTGAVYYANTLFTWTDNVKKIMILFKTKEEE